jgi:hypothetical protein
MNPLRITSRILIVTVSVSLLTALPVRAEIPAAPPFAQTWKLMSSIEKQQFVAGYLFGLRDAARMQDVTLNYIRENPAQAVPGIEKIRDLLAAEGVKPDTMVRLVDEYFGDAKNRNATITMAMSLARSRAQ